MKQTLVASDKFSNLSDSEMHAEIARRIDIWTGSLVDLADIIAAAIRRGLDLSYIKNQPLIDVLRKIESGQIDPDMANRFLRSRVFKYLMGLPLDEQRRIASTGTVEVVVRREDTFDVRVMDVDSLTPRQMRLVFTRGRIRTRAEQTAILEDEAKQSKEDEFDTATVNLRIGKHLVPVTRAQKRKFDAAIDKKGVGVIAKALKAAGLL